MGSHPEGGSARPSALSTILRWLRDLLLAILIAAVVIIFVYQPVKVEGTSMMPALADQERIFVNKFSYRFGVGEIERGDLVVFWLPGDRDKSYIKRVIGVPGDLVEIDHGAVRVNGQPLREDYIPPEFRDYSSIPLRKVAPEHYFVLGDRRNSSNDSRIWGLVPRSLIYGKAVFVYWPLDRIGPVR
jgi:signal peptidase I